MRGLRVQVPPLPGCPMGSRVPKSGLTERKTSLKTSRFVIYLGTRPIPKTVEKPASLADFQLCSLHVGGSA